LNTLSERLAADDELGGRELIWQASLSMMRDTPWLGAGFGNGPVELHKYISSLTSEFDHRQNLPSHNPFLEAGVETGCFGMLLYASIIASAVYMFFDQWIRFHKRNGAFSGYFPLVFAVTAGYLASWIKSGGMENHPSFFLLVALLIIPSEFERKTKDSLIETAMRGSRRATMNTMPSLS